MKYVLILLSLVFLFSACKNKKSEEIYEPIVTLATGDVIGYQLLSQISAVWKGPVNSSTSFGNFSDWIIDFRPISASQVNGKSDLTSKEDIFLSFFIADYNGARKLFFRNGGYVGGFYRSSYAILDSISESPSENYYRFIDIVGGINKIYSEVFFRNDSLILKSYTDKNGAQSQAVLHIDWRAKKQEATTANNAITHFYFPKKVSQINLTNAFTPLSNSSTFYNNSLDFYKEENQPYLGKVTVNITKPGAISNKKILLLLSNEPLLFGATFNTANLKYLTRSTFIDTNETQFTYTYMHPGIHHLIGFYDADNNYIFSSGDWVTPTSTTITLGDEEVKSTSINLSYQIP